MRNLTVILIGPMGVGKTSVAKKVSEALQIEYIDIDELRWEYFAQQPDYDEEFVEELSANSGGIDAFRYFKPFEARFTMDILNKYSCGVFDFGAGYTVYEDKELFDKVRSAFSRYEHIILLRYSDNANESLEALRKRHPNIPDDLYYSLNKEFIESPCNEMLASYIVDTKDKTVQDIVDLVLAKVCPA